LLHEIFQRHHIPPDEVYQKEWRHRVFMYASMQLALEPEIEAAKKAQQERRRQNAAISGINMEGR
jgi:hypothetical protein